MFEKKTLFVLAVIGLLLLPISMHYTSFKSGTDDAHAAGCGVYGNTDDSHLVHLPIVAKSTSEYDALMALYNNTQGPVYGWHNSSGWGVGNPCDTAWYGVECDSGHVQRLTLRDNHLEGPIPPELGYLPHLTSLDLLNNYINGSIPPELGNLISLERLVLANNRLIGPIPPELGNLSYLTTLDLALNGLGGSIPPELGNLISLERLILNYTQLSGSIPPELGNLSSLVTLNLRHNDLYGSIPPELGNLSNLNGLYLSHNGLSGVIPGELSNLSSILWLHLTANPLECWETEEALNWALSLEYCNPYHCEPAYFGPTEVCQP